MSVSTDELENTLNSLKQALSLPKTEITRDASIQRFKFCVELSWKMARKVMGTSSSAPKTVIREMAQTGLIVDVQSWFDALEARNNSSHTYKEEVAESVYKAATQFLPLGFQLLEKLKKA